jgi:hypothetical protein
MRLRFHTLYTSTTRLQAALSQGGMMNMFKYLLIGTALCWLYVSEVNAQNKSEARIDEQYGLRIYAPNADWTFYQPEEFNVRAWLKSNVDPVQMRLLALENFDGRSDSDFIAKFKELESRRSFDNIARSGLINERRWHSLTGKRKGVWFSMHLHFDRENILLLSLEAPTKDLFQKYADTPQSLLARLEFDDVSKNRLRRFDVLEVAFVPEGKGEWGRRFTDFKEDLYKSLTKKSGFKEVRAASTSAQEKAVLMTISILSFKYTPSPFKYTTRQPVQTNKYIYFEHTIEAEITFTDKETGKTLSKHQMIGPPVFGQYGDGAIEHILKLIIAKRKQ